MVCYSHSSSVFVSASVVIAALMTISNASSDMAQNLPNNPVDSSREGQSRSMSLDLTLSHFYCCCIYIHPAVAGVSWSHRTWTRSDQGGLNRCYQTNDDASIAVSIEFTSKSATKVSVGVYQSKSWSQSSRTDAGGGSTILLILPHFFPPLPSHRF